MITFYVEKKNFFVFQFNFIFFFNICLIILVVNKSLRQTLLNRNFIIKELRKI